MYRKILKDFLFSTLYFFNYLLTISLIIKIFIFISFMLPFGQRK
nr:MAG TPA: hypothetical protein [Caudoviricetes sp.]